MISGGDTGKKRKSTLSSRSADTISTVNLLIEMETQIASIQTQMAAYYTSHCRESMNTLQRDLLSHIDATVTSGRQDLRSLVCARVSLLSFISHHNNMTSKLSSRIDPLLERMESIILRVEQITDSTCRRNGRPVAKAAISQKLDIPGTNLSRHLRESLTPVQQQICNSVLSNSSILPSIETLGDTYHPCVSLYIKPVNIVRSVLACNSTSTRPRAALMADIYSTTALTEDAQLCGYSRRFTMAHAMVSCGYDPLDVPVYGPIIDESFYRMIAGNVKMYHYTIDSPKISLFRGGIYQELLDMWLDSHHPLPEQKACEWNNELVYNLIVSHTRSTYVTGATILSALHRQEQRVGRAQGTVYAASHLTNDAILNLENRFINTLRQVDEHLGGAIADGTYAICTLRAWPVSVLHVACMHALESLMFHKISIPLAPRIFVAFGWLVYGKGDMNDVAHAIADRLRKSTRKWEQIHSMLLMEPRSSTFASYCAASPHDENMYIQCPDYVFPVSYEMAAEAYFELDIDMLLLSSIERYGPVTDSTDSADERIDTLMNLMSQSSHGKTNSVDYAYSHIPSETMKNIYDGDKAFSNRHEFENACAERVLWMTAAQGIGNGALCPQSIFPDA